MNEEGVKRADEEMLKGGIGAELQKIGVRGIE